MITLHDYESGEEVLVNASSIVAVIPLQSLPPNRELGLPPHARRTRVEMLGNVCFLVRETVEQIKPLIANPPMFPVAADAFKTAFDAAKVVSKGTGDA